MLTVNNLQKTYLRHGKPVGLLDASFTVPQGEIVGILGENGAGKTTLLRSLAGLLPGVKGSALFDEKTSAESRAEISYITGEGSYLPMLTIGEYGQYLAELHPGFDKTRYVLYLDFFKLDYSSVIDSLSTGQKSRVELAAGFAKRCKYYLMDEPFLGKDPFTRKDFIKLMSSTLQGTETILLSTHYLDDVEYFLDRSLILKEGKIVDDMPVDTLHEAGETLLSHMARVYGWEENRYLHFPQE